MVSGFIGQVTAMAVSNQDAPASTQLLPTTYNDPSPSSTGPTTESSTNIPIGSNSEAHAQRQTIIVASLLGTAILATLLVCVATVMLRRRTRDKALIQYQTTAVNKNGGREERGGV